MNKGDSELIALSLIKAGFSESESDIEADILVFNTCSVRQHAEDRVLSRIASVKNKLRHGSLIILAGCMAQRTGNKPIIEGVADIVIGPYQSPKTGEIVRDYLTGKKNNLFISQSYNDFITRIDPELADKKDDLPWHKWLTITHGCENYCSYCIVPYVRGPLISFPSESIVNYAERLANEGITEITLLGQNVNQYGNNSDISFYRLLEKISKISAFTRINFLTSHPKDFDENIIRVIRDNANISRSIHLPLQSGSNTILRAMNRQYTIEHYLNIIEKINTILDRYSVSTDLIVGFPGETVSDFNATLDMVKKIKFDDAFTYAYSPREGTAAYTMEETISGQEKTDRLKTLIEVQREISRHKLLSILDSNEEMIVERISKKSDKEVMGKTFLNHPVVISGRASDIGKKIKVRVTKLKGSTLYGKRIA